MSIFSDFLLFVGIACSAALPVGAQQKDVDKVQQSNEIRSLIDSIEKRSGLSIDEIVASRYTKGSQNDAREAWLSQVKPVDFGYLLKDKSGEPIEIFGPTTPVEKGEAGDLRVIGYDGVPATVERVGAVEYNSAMRSIVEKMQLENGQDSTRSALANVSRLADRAAMIAASEMCPDGVYPTELELYMDAGFDFVVVNSQTGSKLLLRMADVCSDFVLFLKDEEDRLSSFIPEGIAPVSLPPADPASPEPRPARRQR